MTILHQFFIHRTTFNGHSYKHCLIMTHSTNFDSKTIANVHMQVTEARVFVVTAPAVTDTNPKMISANSCCWQLKQRNGGFMSTAMVNTIILPLSKEVSMFLTNWWYNVFKGGRAVSHLLWYFISFLLELPKKIENFQKKNIYSLIIIRMRIPK
jgi:hypothetical protein